MPGHDVRTLWISWYAHRRTTGLCAAWGIRLEVINSRHAGIHKWADQAIETIRLLRRERPDLLFVQNPSLGATVLAVLARPWFRYQLVIDAHNEGVRPFIRSGRWIHWLTTQLLKKADFTIVTNAALAHDVRVAGGRPLILPDPLPSPTLGTAAPPVEAPDVLAISTFAPDEPLHEILEAASRMPDVRFAITGNPKNPFLQGSPLPKNVRLTGYLPEQEYWSLLAASNIVLDLTLMPDCLVCGAYEALAAARPMVLSDNDASRELFAKVAILTHPNSNSVATAIHTALTRQSQMEAAALEARAVYETSWKMQSDTVWNEILSAAAHKPLRREV
jgi:glycosyltransferase involved in cell wall biosynthesis